MSEEKYRQAHYERLTVRIGKGKLDILKDYAKAQDKSVNALILEALWKCYRLDLKSPLERPDV